MLKFLPLLLAICFQDGFVCPAPYSPIVREAKSCDLVALVTLENVATIQQDKVLEFTIQKLLKAPPGQQALKRFNIPYDERPMNPDIACKEYLIFGEIKPGNLNIFRMESSSKELNQYVQSLLKCEDTPSQLRCVFPFLNSGDKQVATDASTTFRERPDDELYAYRILFDPDKLRNWLNTRTPEHRDHALYAKLIGYCGKAEDVPLLERLFKDHTHVEEYLISIIELKPQHGWNLASQLLLPAKGEVTFIQKHAALKALRHAKSTGRSLPPEKVEHELLEEGLKHEDIADLFIEDIRRWKKWEYSRKIFSLYQPESNSMTKRSIVRFALQTTEPRAQTFLDLVRKSNPEMVKDCEEILQLEKDSEIPRK